MQCGATCAIGLNHSTIAACHVLQCGKMMLAKLPAVIIAPLQRVIDCIVVLAELPAVTIAPLQRVMHAAARLVAGPRPRDNVTQILRELHWLPVVYHDARRPSEVKDRNTSMTS